MIFDMKTFRRLIVVLILALAFLAFAFGYFLSGKTRADLPVVVNEATSTIAFEEDLSDESTEDEGVMIVLEKNDPPVVQEAEEELEGSVVSEKKDIPPLENTPYVEESEDREASLMTLRAGAYEFVAGNSLMTVIVKNSQYVGFDDGCNVGFGSLVWHSETSSWNIVAYGHTQKKCADKENLVALIDKNTKIESKNQGLWLDLGAKNFVALTE